MRGSVVDLGWRGFCAFALSLGWTVSARAELIVLQSDVPKISAKSRLPDSTALDVPEGRQIRVVFPSGKTRILRGPVKGTVGEIAKGEHKAAGLWNKVIGFVNTGGVSETQMAADRGPFYMLNGVPLGAKGSICAERSTPPRLTRARSDDVVDVTIGDNERRHAVTTLHFAKGVKELPWPSEIPRRDNATYQISPADSAAINVTLRLLPDSQEADSALVAFYERNCQVQLGSWLGQHTDAK